MTTDPIKFRGFTLAELGIQTGQFKEEFAAQVQALRHAFPDIFDDGVQGHEEHLVLGYLAEEALERRNNGLSPLSPNIQGIFTNAFTAAKKAEKREAREGFEVIQFGGVPVADWADNVGMTKKEGLLVQAFLTQRNHSAKNDDCGDHAAYATILAKANSLDGFYWNDIEALIDAVKENEDVSKGLPKLTLRFLRGMLQERIVFREKQEVSSADSDALVKDILDGSEVSLSPDSLETQRYDKAEGVLAVYLQLKDDDIAIRCLLEDANATSEVLDGSKEDRRAAFEEIIAGSLQFYGLPYTGTDKDSILVAQYLIATHFSNEHISFEDVGLDDTALSKVNTSLGAFAPRDFIEEMDHFWGKEDYVQTLLLAIKASSTLLKGGKKAVKGLVDALTPASIQQMLAQAYAGTKKHNPRMAFENEAAYQARLTGIAAWTVFVQFSFNFINTLNKVITLKVKDVEEFGYQFATLMMYRMPGLKVGKAKSKFNGAKPFILPGKNPQMALSPAFATVGFSVQIVGSNALAKTGTVLLMAAPPEESGAGVGDGAGQGYDSYYEGCGLSQQGLSALSDSLLSSTAGLGQNVLSKSLAARGPAHTISYYLKGIVQRFLGYDGKWGTAWYTRTEQGFTYFSKGKPSAYGQTTTNPTGPLFRVKHSSQTPAFSKPGEVNRYMLTAEKYVDGQWVKVSSLDDFGPRQPSLTDLDASATYMQQHVGLAVRYIERCKGHNSTPLAFAEELAKNTRGFEPVQAIQHLRAQLFALNPKKYNRNALGNCTARYDAGKQKWILEDVTGNNPSKHFQLHVENGKVTLFKKQQGSEGFTAAQVPTDYSNVLRAWSN